ncbi:MAG: hypothetical protein GY803_04615 [Chloroflexi bacterium]|nr:hypothetical protein [Chloroflexota bacterium]
MINWFSVFSNSFWIIGLAILLAAFSYHYWLADQENRRLREQLSQPAFHKSFWVSFVFIGIGLAGTSQKSWEAGLWIIFTLFSIVNTVKAQ